MSKHVLLFAPKNISMINTLEDELKKILNDDELVIIQSFSEKLLLQVNDYDIVCIYDFLLKAGEQLFDSTFKEVLLQKPNHILVATTQISDSTIVFTGWQKLVLKLGYTDITDSFMEKIRNITKIVNNIIWFTPEEYEITDKVMPIFKDLFGIKPSLLHWFDTKMLETKKSEFKIVVTTDIIITLYNLTPSMINLLLDDKIVICGISRLVDKKKKFIKWGNLSIKMVCENLEYNESKQQLIEEISETSNITMDIIGLLSILGILTSNNTLIQKGLNGIKKGFDKLFKLYKEDEIDKEEFDDLLINAKNKLLTMFITAINSKIY